MNYASTEFLILLSTVLIAYYALDQRHQNNLLLAASLVFYSWGDFRCLPLLILICSNAHITGKRLPTLNSEASRRTVLILSLALSVGILCFFKYIGFLCLTFNQMLGLLHVQYRLPEPEIILPIGISFYTFQAISYTVDVFRGHCRPTTRLKDTLLFLAYFPQLVAGPIERASDLIPQFDNRRAFCLKGFTDGIFLAAVGLAKKLVIADNISTQVNAVFSNAEAAGITVALSSLAFAIQIYCDFSGYSDIARGVSQMLGITLSRNFDLPYFSTNPSDLWHRWHMSLSTWLRDYIYIPLGGNRKGSVRTSLNLFVTMTLGGLWHGASAHFLLWGAYHGLLLVTYRFLKSLRTKPRPPETLTRRQRVVYAFCFLPLTCYGWVLFRVGSVTQAVSFTKAILIPAQWGSLGDKTALLVAWKLLILGLPVLALDAWALVSRRTEPWGQLRPTHRAILFVAACYLCVIAGELENKSFIYFQF
jgi:alginate O-acetyltransferase complex protein AlgI